MGTGARDPISRMRLALFLLVAGLHGIALFFLVFHLDTAVKNPEPAAQVLKLVDLQEDTPPPTPAPPPPPEPPPQQQQQMVEAVAETMIETDEVPEDQVVVDSLPYEAPPQPVQVQTREIEYLPQHQVSKTPVFSEQDIRKNLVYPPIALRSGIEGTVILELFVDVHGEIQRIIVLKENPLERGFGEAAKNAFQGIRALSPAEANGTAVAIRYRYPFRFVLR
ncbi:MAG: TonB family protein [Treponema sp.]|jgi:protein TonB|nr:TonB family protein [Treponema sp.]